MSSTYKELLQVNKRKGKSPVGLVVCFICGKKPQKSTSTDFGDSMVEKISAMLWVGT